MSLLRSFMNTAKTQLSKVLDAPPTSDAFFGTVLPPASVLQISPISPDGADDWLFDEPVEIIRPKISQVAPPRGAETRELAIA